ncbi:choice-of-anchor Q domain-containing protein [Dyella sp.]|jgi:hypothetical protein|uniref:choice-of-anchor Q domain-containing protein n=1 Tax=Dyella sp. TaxID=1869338 RepID=UPI002D791828|nr:choice-of-anchor Q domain-containing protein [Dyella sp.]HET6432663.1 choice-of-anchor Q domain-containing protein [Dyella sp.]
MRQFLFRPLASGGPFVCVISAALLVSSALPSRAASAATVHVMNCNDSGVGSLRGSIASAQSGDTIDARHLSCHLIRLTGGEIRIAQHDMTIIGPGSRLLTVDADRAGRAFLHDAPSASDNLGTLVIKQMTVANGGYAGATGSGGCVASNSNLELQGVDVHGCFGGSGGGVFADYGLRLLNSNIFDNVADGVGGGAAAFDMIVYRSRIYGNHASRWGGGATAQDMMTLSYSTVDGNRSQSEGGGVYAEGRLVVNKSTVSNNAVTVSDYGRPGGGVWGRAIYVIDSTVSGNEAFYGSAIWAMDSLQIANSTIAFNRETGSESLGAVVVYHFTGLAALPGAQAGVPAYNISSSIVADNLWRGNPGYAFEPDSIFFVHGYNNIFQQSPIPVPPDTMTLDPLLAPLADNGGPTMTHALLNGSPAIDRGNNLRHRHYDQRGPGFARVQGSAPDIGAFELCPADTRN